MTSKTKLTVGSLFLSLLVTLVVSCSSNDKKDEGTSPDVAEATADTGVPPDPNATGDQAPPADATASGDQANTPPADASSLDAPPADPNAPPAAPGGDMAATDQPPVDPNSPPPGDSAAPPADPNAAAGTPPAGDLAQAAPPADTSAAPPPADTTSSAPPTNDVFGAAGATSDAPTGEEPPKKKHVPLAHIKDTPFTKGGQNLNTVYIARDGDTVETISQKLFGEDHSKDLKKANPTLKKGVKAGDKVYFNSPNRPDDKEKMLTVYEDQGLPPSVYTTKEGDTLKSLAQEWFGTEASYKEIYALNKNLASTTDLPAGTEIQYWPASATVAVYGAKKEADVAEANNAPPPPAGNVPPPPGMGGAANNPPGSLPPGGMPGNNPPPAMGAMGNNAPGSLPPGAVPGGMDAGAPPPDMNAAAPPPAAPMARHKTKDLGGAGAMDKDTIFYAGLAGILLISSALWFALRRRRSRNSGVTQI